MRTMFSDLWKSGQQRRRSGYVVETQRLVESPGVSALPYYGFGDAVLILMFRLKYLTWRLTQPDCLIRVSLFLSFTSTYG